MNDFGVGDVVVLDALEEFEAVELGHFQVGHDDVEVARQELFQGLGPVGRGDHLVALGLQVLGQRDPLDLLVVGDQDSHSCSVIVPPNTESVGSILQSVSRISSMVNLFCGHLAQGPLRATR